jgi:hypothetical protein
MSRDKDNREKKSDPASPTTTRNNVKEENTMNAKALKRKSLEENEIVTNGIYDCNKQVSVIVKEDVMDHAQEQDNNFSPPQHKKKVKAKIRMSKPDLNAFNSPPSNPHISSSPQQKVNIDTKINNTIPNATNSSHTATNTPAITQNTNATDIIPHTTNTTLETIKTTTSTIGTPNTNAPSRTLSKSDALPSAKTKEGAVGSTQQQDKMQKLSFLTDLYDQGYITVVEYKERKSQIIDELTGTRTRTRNNSHIMRILLFLSLYTLSLYLFLFISFLPLFRLLP